jgi:hypothetical protein
MVATGFELLGELEGEFEEQALELEPLFPKRPAHYPSVTSAWKRGSSEYELFELSQFESTQEQKKLQKTLLDFRTQIHLRPQNFRRLILIGRLHPFPERSQFIASFPVPNYSLGLLSLVIDSFGLATGASREAYQQIVDELGRIADRKFKNEIAAETRVGVSAAESIRYKLDHKELRPLLLEAAMLYPPKSRVDPADLSNEFLKLGLQLIGQISTTDILASEADEAHITRLGWHFAEYANTLQKKDSAFRKLVEQERQRRKQTKVRENEFLFGRGGGFEFSGSARARRRTLRATLPVDFCDEREEELMELVPLFPRVGSISYPYSDEKRRQAFKKTTWAMPELEDKPKPCNEIWAVAEFAPGSSKLQSFQKRHINDFMTKIARSLLPKLMGKEKKDIDFELRFEGHVDKESDPKAYGTLDEDRARAVADEIGKSSMKTVYDIFFAQLDAKNVPGMSVRYGSITGVGSSRRFSATNKKLNRRVVVCVSWTIGPAAA